MRLLAILFAVSAAGLGFAALHEARAANTIYKQDVEQAAAQQATRDHEIAQATHVAQVIAHTTGPLPFGLVPATASSTGVGAVEDVSETPMEDNPKPMLVEKIAETRPEAEPEPQPEIDEHWTIY